MRMVMATLLITEKIVGKMKIHEQKNKFNEIKYYSAVKENKRTYKNVLCFSISIKNKDTEN